MNEYISREAVLKAFKLKLKNPKKDYQRGMQDAIDCLIPEALADIPSADVQPVVHAEWICHEPEIGLYYSCSKCGHNALQGMYKFCPNCGAKMDGGEKL